MSWPKGKPRKPGNALEQLISGQQEPEAAPEQQMLQEVVSVPTASHVPAASRTWLVSIPHNPELRVEAPDREEAIKEYFRLRNIVSTTHPIDCREVV